MEVFPARGLTAREQLRSISPKVSPQNISSNEKSRPKAALSFQASLAKVSRDRR
jgi:hypothetical protein